MFAASDRPYPDKVRTLRLKALNGILSETSLPKHLEGDPRCTLQTEAKVGFHLFHRHEPMTVHQLRRGELNKPGAMVKPAFPRR